jgi:hypothetical protein
MKGQEHERARTEKQEKKYTAKSLLQPKQAGLNLAVAGTPNANLLVVMLTVEPPESLQLVNLGATALDFAPQGCVKLVHLAVVLCREEFLLFSQPAIKLQLQR